MHGERGFRRLIRTLPRPGHPGNVRRDADHAACEFRVFILPRDHGCAIQLLEGFVEVVISDPPAIRLGDENPAHVVAIWSRELERPAEGVTKRLREDRHVGAAGDGDHPFSVSGLDVVVERFPQALRCVQMRYAQSDADGFLRTAQCETGFRAAIIHRTLAKDVHRRAQEAVCIKVGGHPQCAASGGQAVVKSLNGVREFTRFSEVMRKFVDVFPGVVPVVALQRIADIQVGRQTDLGRYTRDDRLPDEVVGEPDETGFVRRLHEPMRDRLVQRI